ncbi:RNA polymerase sigma factor [Subtercola endophyticus]|uniref:RNA polymerase sigma factor n=1 Tax=Subtercola endophyticus TaxID=2895559 RepID=UPI001E39DC12|nr:sigma-70 family RNA polymerase sigma factor [Subtercola endophyticus]UFS60922.1 sigma-70 family RNA polymerase sigma factor [Subtercola endophyticus]
MTDVPEAVTRLAREQSGRVLALLAARFGDLDLADEAVQDALLAASGWKHVPDNPPAWLYTVARNNAIDRLRRAAAERRRLLAAAPDLTGRVSFAEPEHAALEEEPMIVEHSEVGDEQLRLMLLCCHPALDRDTQVALTLRLVGGLSTPEIAAAFLLPEATLAQRIVRAKRKVRDAGIPLSIPQRLDDRVQALLTVLYLVFNEGYLARGGAPGIRIDLVDEAIRLTRQAAELLPDSAEVEGLLALELFTHARSEARFVAGELVLLDAQDRSRWDARLIASGDAVLARALRRMTPGPFQLQAIIAAYHAKARSSVETHWRAIVRVYDQLVVMMPSAVVELNRAVAVSMVEGPEAGLRLIDAINGLDAYYLYWAVRGELLSRSGRTADAILAVQRALTLATNPAEQQHLRGRLAALGDA